MSRIEFPQLPFLTREMLKNGNQMSFSLFVTVVSGIQKTIEIRGFTRTGIIRQKITTPADGSGTTVRIGIDDIPIMVVVYDNLGQFLSNECWSGVALEINGLTVGELCSGFISREKKIAWPPIDNKDLILNRGAISAVESADPSAGANISLSVPDGELWLIHAAFLTFVTDSASANRRIHFIFTSAGGTITTLFSSIDQTLSLTRKYTIAKFGTIVDEANDKDILISLPNDLWLDGTGSITTVVKNFQGGDNLSKLELTVEKFFDRDL